MSYKMVAKFCFSDLFHFAGEHFGIYWNDCNKLFWCYDKYHSLFDYNNVCQIDYLEDIIDGLDGTDFNKRDWDCWGSMSDIEIDFMIREDMDSLTVEEINILPDQFKERAIIWKWVRQFPELFDSEKIYKLKTPILVDCKG